MLSIPHCANTETDAVRAASRLYEEILHRSSWSYTSTRMEALVQANTPVVSSQFQLVFDTTAPQQSRPKFDFITGSQVDDKWKSGATAEVFSFSHQVFGDSEVFGGSFLLGGFTSLYI